MAKLQSIANPPTPEIGTDPAAKAAYDPDKDYLSTLFLELGQATAIVDLLFLVAAGKAGDSVDGLHEDTLTNSLHTVLERLQAVKVAAEAILDDGQPVVLKQEVAHG